MTRAVHDSGPALRGVKLQDFTDFVYYLPVRIWEQLQVLELLELCLGTVASFLARLGLLNPSEPRSQLLTSLAYHLPGGTEGSGASEPSATKVWVSPGFIEHVYKDPKDPTLNPKSKNSKAQDNKSSTSNPSPKS